MTKLLRAASVALALALIPRLAAADTGTAEATQQFVMTATPSATLADIAPTAAARGSSEVGSFALGPTLGLITGNSITAFRITGEGQYTLTELAHNFYFDLAGHAGLALGSASGCPAGVSCPSVTIFEIVPKARVRYVLPSESRISFYGDGGLGIAFASLGTVTVGGLTFGGGSQTWGLFRIGGGIQYKVTPSIILVGEPLGLNIYFGSGSGFMYSLAAGVLFKL